jgi:putative transposase
MNPPFRTKMDHRPSEWVDTPTYFITICASGRGRGRNQLCTDAAPEILRSIEFYHKKNRWFCEYTVLMPDHVHLLLSFHENDLFAKVVGDWKRWLTRRCAIKWQENFFEHRLRNDESINSTALYMLNNPVRAGLIDDPQKWPWFWQPAA